MFVFLLLFGVFLASVTPHITVSLSADVSLVLQDLIRCHLTMPPSPPVRTSFPSSMSPEKYPADPLHLALITPHLFLKYIFY